MQEDHWRFGTHIPIDSTRCRLRDFNRAAGRRGAEAPKGLPLHTEASHRQRSPHHPTPPAPPLAPLSPPPSAPQLCCPQDGRVFALGLGRRPAPGPAAGPAPVARLGRGVVSEARGGQLDGLARRRRRVGVGGGCVCGWRVCGWKWKWKGIWGWRYGGDNGGPRWGGGRPLGTKLTNHGLATSTRTRAHNIFKQHKLSISLLRTNFARGWGVLVLSPTRHHPPLARPER